MVSRIPKPCNYCVMLKLRGGGGGFMCGALGSRKYANIVRANLRIVMHSSAMTYSFTICKEFLDCL